ALPYSVTLRSSTDFQSRRLRFRRWPAESSFTRAIYVGRLQQLFSGRSLALQAQERSTIVEGFRAARVSRRLLGPSWLAGSFCFEGMDRSAISILCGLEE